jgi:hypothetical protein
MKTFGNLPFMATSTTQIERVPAPVGEPCAWCREPIAPTDHGVIIPYLDSAGAFERPQHEACFMRSLYGSVGHLRRQCQCYGGTGGEDPSGMTRRQAAEAAQEEFLKMAFAGKATCGACGHLHGRHLNGRCYGSTLDVVACKCPGYIGGS